MRRIRHHLQRKWGAAGLALVGFLGAPALTSAQPPPSAEAIETLRKTKAPEDWTIEERLAVRFDPRDASRRLEADHQQRRNWGDDTIDPADNTIIVDGAKNPELILPWELYERLLHTFTAPKEVRDFQREQIRPTLRSLGFDEELFWPTLEKVSGRVLEIKRNVRELAESLAQVPTVERHTVHAKIEAAQATLCQDRAAALKEAREVFGSAKFDRLLYRGVAPSIKIAMPYDPDWHEHLLAVEDCRR